MRQRVCTGRSIRVSKKTGEDRSLSIQLAIRHCRRGIQTAQSKARPRWNIHLQTLRILWMGHGDETL